MPPLILLHVSIPCNQQSRWYGRTPRCSCDNNCIEEKPAWVLKIHKTEEQMQPLISNTPLQSPNKQFTNSLVNIKSIFSGFFFILWLLCVAGSSWQFPHQGFSDFKTFNEQEMENSSKKQEIQGLFLSSYFGHFEP